jgi:hypothetical protein
VSRVLLLLLLLALPAGAVDRERCRQLRERRDELGRQALEAELVLVRRIRGQLCPELSRRAEAANAVEEDFEPIDFGALRRCRQRTEERLAATRPVLTRNRLDFPFYTERGAELARQADQVDRRMEREGCPTPR